MAWFGTGKRKQLERAAHGARRRAREKAAGRDELTLDQLWERDRYCCICKLPVARAQASVEHRVPLARGGTGAADNLALSHMRCNSAKGARTAPRRKGLRRTRWAPRHRPKDIPDDVF